MLLHFYNVTYIGVTGTSSTTNNYVVINTGLIFGVHHMIFILGTATNAYGTSTNSVTFTVLMPTWTITILSFGVPPISNNTLSNSTTNDQGNAIAGYVN